MIRGADDRPSLPWRLLLIIAGFSVLAVYCTSMSLSTIDVATGTVARTESLKLYRDALAGLRDFPYQWRLLGIYLVYAGERLTGVDPHVVDLAAKVALLCASASILFLFSRFYTTQMGALCGVALYLLVTVAGFADQYTIYFTNDYVMIACWFGAVYCLKTGRSLEAAALTFVGAWAKETMVLVPILAAIGWLRSRGTAGLAPIVLTTAAFLIPTIALRSIYRAPVTQWAWWHMLFVNVPFLQSSLHDLGTTLKNNLKVALFFNVLWVLAARAALRASDAFSTDLALTAIAYLVLAYPVIVLRELRHFLPLAIVVLPLALAEIERRDRATPSTHPTR
jgi:hypothetical protein